MTLTKNIKTLTDIMKEVKAEHIGPRDKKWLNHAANVLLEQEQAINQLKADLEFQGNKIKELTLDCKSYHEFFAKHDPMGYRAYYTQHLPSWISK